MSNIIIQSLKQLLSQDIKPRLIFNGHFVLSSFVDGDTFYELQVITHKEYGLSLLIDDTWAFNVFLQDKKELKYKKVYYLMHPSFMASDKHIVVDDPDYLYFLPFNRIDKYFLNYEDYKYYDIPEVISKILNGDIVYTLKPTEKEKPLVSIITTVFNNAKLLEQTIQSVINQNNYYVEYIVKDAQSNDSFCDVINRYEEYIDIIISKPDSGIYEGMHQGFIAAHGEYVQILNSDDILMQNVSGRYVNVIKKEKYDFYNAYVYSHRNGKVTLLKPDLSALYKMNRICHTTMAFNRELYFAMGGFNLKMKCAADGDLTIRAIKMGALYKTIELPVVHFRAEGFSTQPHIVNVKEFFICRYRYKKFNPIGYYYGLKKLLYYIIRAFPYYT